MLGDVSFWYRCHTHHRRFTKERLEAVRDRMRSVSRSYTFQSQPFPRIPAQLFAEDRLRHRLPQCSDICPNLVLRAVLLLVRGEVYLSWKMLK